ncbi:uncharacterized protein BT62DRAFT_574092 [Guyanagaster necrorhizus]|uniref:Uncharacterized protein n=1 Tax=Guyanagaster necrorhizus TaxID=856835 RepID=A0A9P8AM11_9AGAR|nr:uncharacterized protein BT62DRAFT_574092 [Guyanagaster necrorhizus MCA 3950]KAG7440793.1 hypothetical protein BT62DRAFT_574092 [Guyanagaster necrorhizus MCA 3950]
MSPCNHAVSRTTIEVFIGLGITFPFNFFAHEEARIAVATPPPMSHSRAKSCPNSSSPIFLPFSFCSVSPSLCHRSSKSRLYKRIGLGHPSSKLVTHDEVTTPASKRRGVSNTVILSTNSGRKLASSINVRSGPPDWALAPFLRGARAPPAATWALPIARAKAMLPQTFRPLSLQFLGDSTSQLPAETAFL